MGSWFRRLLAALADLAALGGFALGLVRLCTNRVPLTADFLFLIALAALVLKAVFGLNEGLFHGLGRMLRGPGAAWDQALFGWLYRRRAAVALGTVMTLLLLGVVEIGLRLSIPFLPPALANELYRGYTAAPDGIYYEDYRLGVYRMRPDYRRPMFFSGYRWTHQTDALGFRNPATLTQADVVLLGDSMIYGHGAEENQTVASHLRADTGRRVANLGQQGVGIHEEYQFLLHYGRPLKPRWVFLFLLNNDLHDTLRRLSAEEMRRFIAAPDDDLDPSYVQPRDAPRSSPLKRRLQGWSERLYLVRAKSFLLKVMEGKKRLSLYDSTGDARFTPAPPGEPFRSRPDLELAVEFQAKAFRRLRLMAERDGFQLAVIYLYTEQKYDDAFAERFGEISRRDGIAYHDFRDLSERAIAAGRRIFLPRDGHYTDDGARMAAAELVRLYPALVAKP